jgi:hypothetical protein
MWVLGVSDEDSAVEANKSTAEALVGRFIPTLILGPTLLFCCNERVVELWVMAGDKQVRWRRS